MPLLELLERISSFDRLKRVTARILCLARHKRNKSDQRSKHLPLEARELADAEKFWVLSAQQECFYDEMASLRDGKEPSSRQLLSLHPFLDEKGLLRVGGTCRLSQSEPMVLPGKHRVTRMIIRQAHEDLLHAGPTRVAAFLSSRFCILGARRAIRSVTRSCVVCRRVAGKPTSQLLGQLPRERVSPGLMVFSHTGVDYAGPILVKSGPVRKPLITKAYVCVFVSFSVKAVHLEVVTDLSTAAFIATLRRFVGRRGKPSVMWSDHGTNFVGAARKLKELYEAFGRTEAQNVFSDFCSSQGIQWNFTPEHAPHFGGLWEAAVKSFKYHLLRVVGDVRLTYEELATVLVQIEACLNSRPLVALPPPEDGIEVLTPGHFLVGAALDAMPDTEIKTPCAVHLLRRWNLCQYLVQHMWK